jgi:multiple sugar transport system permease protein
VPALRKVYSTFHYKIGVKSVSLNGEIIEIKTKKIKKRHLSTARREGIQGYIFISPWIIGFLAFVLGPMLFALFASFTDYDITSRMNFVGFENYNVLLFKEKIFWIALSNTLYYVMIKVPIATILSVLLAVLLNQKISGLRFFRTIYYLPSVLTGVAMYILWMQLLIPQSGLINTVLHYVGIEGPAWLTDPNWTKPAIILMSMWRVGGGMLLFLSCLQGIPGQLYESAELDGANSFKKFIHITIPMITPVIFFELVTGIIGAFQIFSEGYVMSDSGTGAPMNSLLFYNLYLWNQAFKVFNMGKATAMAYILFIIIMFFTVINLKLSKRWVYYEGGDNK